MIHRSLQPKFALPQRERLRHIVRLCGAVAQRNIERQAGGVALIVPPENLPQHIPVAAGKIGKRHCAVAQVVRRAAQAIVGELSEYLQRGLQAVFNASQLRLTAGNVQIVLSDFHALLERFRYQLLKRWDVFFFRHRNLIEWNYMYQRQRGTRYAITAQSIFQDRLLL